MLSTVRSVDKNAQLIEREMTIHQRGLVDTCFEEGQYEQGIAALQQLRSPMYKPYGPHIRQLLYLALYPPAPPDERMASPAGLISPSKLASKQQYAVQPPTAEASNAAMDTLVAFALTNTPGALFRALPRYSSSGFYNSTGDTSADMGNDDEDSYISCQAVQIRNAKNCWEILKEGFVQVVSQKGKGQKLRGAFSDMEFDSLGMGFEPPCVVGAQAWPVLEWMLNIFEKDEQLTERAGQPRHSPLLLMQLPYYQNSSGIRSDTEAPLNIIFYCIQQEDVPRRMSGIRLLALLIALTSTTLIDLPMLLNAVCRRMAALQLDTLATIFTLLPRSLIVYRFKTLLCKNFLAEFIGGSSTSAGGRPAPKARQPRPAPVRRRIQESMNDVPGLGSTPRSVPSVARKYPIVSASTMLSLLKTSNGSDSENMVRTCKFKYELVVACRILQSIALDTEKDPEWLNIFQDGSLRAALESAFSGDGARKVDKLVVQNMKDMLLANITVY